MIQLGHKGGIYENFILVINEFISGIKINFGLIVERIGIFFSGKLWVSHTGCNNINLVY